MTELAVVKVGGNELDDDDWVRELATALARRAGPVALVHGGGKEVTTLQRALGSEPVWNEGLRVTTPEGMRAVRMALSGMANKRLAAALLDAGVDAVGISGEDGALLRAEPARGGALGSVGEIRAVRSSLLLGWLADGIVPVISPVSRGPGGQPLNVNADDAAAAVALALDAAELLFVSNVPGVRVGDATIADMDAADVEARIADGTASGGMAPKLRAAARAAKAVARVRIGSLDMLGNPAAGTRIRPALLLGHA